MFWQVAGRRCPRGRVSGLPSAIAPLLSLSRVSAAMRRSTDRILVSHAGTLPRPPEIVALLQPGSELARPSWPQKLPGRGRGDRPQAGRGGRRHRQRRRDPQARHVLELYPGAHRGHRAAQFAVGEGPPPRDVNGRDRKDFPGFFGAGLGGFGQRARHVWRRLRAARRPRRERTLQFCTGAADSTSARPAPSRTSAT